ncbi:MAG: Fic family protein [Holophagales bacterium]|nr:MAG: Fic family protein [Holophagales bacterium]
MKRGVSGNYEVTTTAGEAVRAFVPNPLPPDPPIDLTGERQKLLERALLACGRLDGISALLPDPELFLYAYVRREALLSSQIEGTQSSLSDLLLFEMEEAPGVPFDDVVEVSNYVAAQEHGLNRLRGGFPLSNRLLREVHGRLLERGRGAEKAPGEFRRTQNWVGGTRPGDAHFVPCPPARVEECMAALERFLHDAEPGLPTLVKAALAHAQFETIHPFLDGNGRVGRLLIALLLNEERVIQQPLLYLSLFLKQHRAEYYRLLDEVRLQGDWEAWVEFFLEGVAQTAGAAVATAHRLLTLFREDEGRISGQGRKSSSLLRLFAALRSRPLTTITDLSRRSGLSFPTAATGAEALVKLGIARELTGRERNRVFLYDRYVAILGEGAEPL